ncbi:MAG: hypothetical protein JWM10_3159 [Myxococcaceae bacterium]|nr:hypothetical protein [Myxococcaceae bacterium]
MKRHFSLLAAVVVCAPAIAVAQPSPLDAEARAAFERGMADVSAGRFANAVAAFEYSYRVRPVAIVLYNLAAACSRLGRYQQAISNYERYLAEGGAGLAPDRVQSVRDRIDELRREQPVVVLRLQPTAFTLTVDGRPQVVVGDEVSLDPGSHLLVASAPGHASQQREVQLTPGMRFTWEARLDATMVAVAPGSVTAPVRPVVTPHPASAPEAPASRGVTSQWWFWTGAGVLVAGGVTAIVLGATGAFTSTEDPLPGTSLDVSTLRVR